MEKNIKEIKETIKADLAFIKNYKTPDGTFYNNYGFFDKTIIMKATIEHFNIGIRINIFTIIWANDVDYSLTEDFETAWSDMVKNYSDYEAERLRKEIENKWF